MKQTVLLADFTKAFEDYGREGNFSHDGQKALYNYLLDLEDDIGEGFELELDVIALCTEYAEYDNIKQFQEDYGGEYKTIDDIREDTSVIKIDDKRFIVELF